jgi:hypothetical protein
MELAQLYESPFTDVAPLEPDGIFTPTQVDELAHALERVSATGVA